jgi:probable F420-dependent oxidoreductase
MTLRYNLLFPTRAVKRWAHWSEGASLGEMALLVEDAGFDGFSAIEHPYPDKHWLAHHGPHAFDPFVALSFAAASTSRIRVITHVMVSAYRNPYLAAKSAASLDVLSGGRFILGTAAGYLKSEFEALGADYQRRGQLLDEAIQAWKSTWSGHAHTGTEFGVADHVALPLPSTPGGPPIWIGGNSAAAQRRVVEVADGWIPMAASGESAAMTGARPLQKIGTLAEWIAGVNRRRAEVGRGPADVSFQPFEAHLLARGDACDMFCAALRPRLDAYAEAGVTWLTVEPTSRSFDDFRADVDVLASKLIHA